MATLLKIIFNIINNNMNDSTMIKSSVLDEYEKVDEEEIQKLEEEESKKNNLKPEDLDIDRIKIKDEKMYLTSNCEDSYNSQDSALLKMSTLEASTFVHEETNDDSDELSETNMSNESDNSNNNNNVIENVEYVVSSTTTMDYLQKYSNYINKEYLIYGLVGSFCCAIGYYVYRKYSYQQ